MTLKALPIIFCCNLIGTAKEEVTDFRQRTVNLPYVRPANAQELFSKA